MLLTVSQELKKPLREKFPNTEFFLVPIFSHLNWIWRDTEYLSVFSPNAGKYGPDKTPYLDTFYTRSIAHVLAALKNFHKNTEFTYEVEENGKLAFLEVFIIRNNSTLKTTT